MNNEVQEEARYNARMRAALLAANEALRKEIAALRNSVDYSRLEARRNEASSQAWMYTAWAADDGIGIYTAVFQEAMKQVAAGTHCMEGVRQMYESARVYRAEELSRCMQRLAVPAVPEGTAVAS